MRAVRCVDGVPSVVDVADPSGDGVVVTVASAGICGSDLHLLGWNLPWVMGHEFAGTLPDGTPVAAEPIAPCGECERCRDGAYNLCVRGPAMVMGVGRDGAIAERCVVPVSALVPLPAGVPVQDACLIEPLAVAVHGARRGRVSSGDRVAVVGGGSIGQLSVVACRATGALVDMEARHEHQRAAALRLGAGTVGDAYDVVIEAAGTTGALGRAVELCRAGGRVVLLGSYWDAATFPGLVASIKEIDLVPASLYARSGPSRDFDVAASLLAQQPDMASVVITHRFPLDAASEAFAAAANREAGAIKVVIDAAR